MRLHLFTLALVSAIALAILACGGDDDSAGTSDGAPTATDAPTGTEAAPTDDGDGAEPTPDAGDDGDATPAFSEDFGMPEAGSGGPGSVVIGEETFEYDVIVCSTSDDGVSVWNGRGHTADGTPFVAEVSLMFGFEASAEISVGSSTVADDGDPHWTAEPALNYSFGQNGVAILNYDASFTSSSGDVADGSVDVVCRP